MAHVACRLESLLREHQPSFRIVLLLQTLSLRLKKPKSPHTNYGLWAQKTLNMSPWSCRVWDHRDPGSGRRREKSSAQ